MDIEILLKGFAIGFTIAASIGPIGILCIKRSLEKGFLSLCIVGSKKGANM